MTHPMKSFSIRSLLVVSFLAGATAFATDNIPSCISHGNLLPIDNANALSMERDNNVPNQSKTEAHIKGVVTTVYPDHSGHEHFAIQLGNDPSKESKSSTTRFSAHFHKLLPA